MCVCGGGGGGGVCREGRFCQAMTSIVAIIGTNYVIQYYIIADFCDEDLEIALCHVKACNPVLRATARAIVSYTKK